jgi:E3 ubiquitin-protein ligase DMA1/2
MLNAPEYPSFQCPNCRANTDLEADVDDPLSNFEEEWEEAPADSGEAGTTNGTSSSAAEPPHIRTTQETDEEDVEQAHADGNTVLAHQFEAISLGVGESPVSPVSPDGDTLLSTARPPRVTPMTIGTSLSVPVNGSSLTSPPNTAEQFALTQADIATPDGPMTPRNDAGPFILDGSAGRSGRSGTLANLESVVHEE